MAVWQRELETLFHEISLAKGTPIIVTVGLTPLIHEDL
jgi:hypothetical protein